jgi:rfaE bifunctional protein nucleotidyltransferase chain/domain
VRRTVPMERIVRDHAALARVVAGLRTNGKTVVLAAGAFEVLHPGHVRFLADAASRGDYLVVAVQDDASVRKAKGAGRPAQPASDRAEVLAALPRVHYVTFYSGADASELCALLRPSLLAGGRDRGTEAGIPERAAAEAAGARVAIVGDAKVWSTDRILGAAAKKKAPAKARARA